MRIRTGLLFVLFALGLEAQDAFLVKPYLQLGDAPRPAALERLDLLWHAEDRDATWTVETAAGRGWKAQAAPSFRRLDAPPLPAHRIYRTTLQGLRPGAVTAYRVKLNGQVVFEAEAQVRRPGAHRMIVFGDAADGSPQQAAIAQAVFKERPDAVFITGDLVYGRAVQRQGPVGEVGERVCPLLEVPGNVVVPG